MQTVTLRRSVLVLVLVLGGAFLAPAGPLAAPDAPELAAARLGLLQGL